ncbi:probable ubiquitin-conjugating enzyme E2 37 [Teleopsis dalmanni]|uniref:probable ubiquitin-conjugating enzyme E2 37 n=1 Tax=Teleopsis dalmanni TaxID=139649 RepID=UPI0018CF31E8|nr:probable ubiquitin-conjugating enzyme E2 37 [Teleopsis dalmanni]
MEYFANKRRIDQDIKKLIECNYEVKIISLRELLVIFKGPDESLYDNGVWKIWIILPRRYPLSPPIVIFKNKILHPNIHEQTGAICMNVLYEAWTPIYSLTTIFDTFLPYLLKNPNASDPFNLEAASLFNTNREQYEKRVREYVIRYATEKPTVTDNELVLRDVNNINPETSHDATTNFTWESAFIQSYQSAAALLNSETEDSPLDMPLIPFEENIGADVPAVPEAMNGVILCADTLGEELRSTVEAFNSLVQLEVMSESYENFNNVEALVPVEDVGQITGEDISISIQAVNTLTELESNTKADEGEFIIVDQKETVTEVNEEPYVGVVNDIDLQDIEDEDVQGFEKEYDDGLGADDDVGDMYVSMQSIITLPDFESNPKTDEGEFITVDQKETVTEVNKEPYVGVVDEFDLQDIEDEVVQGFEKEYDDVLEVDAEDVGDIYASMQSIITLPDFESNPKADEDEFITAIQKETVTEVNEELNVGVVDGFDLQDIEASEKEYDDGLDADEEF